MVKIRERILISAIVIGLLTPAAVRSQKFFSDDPIQVVPPPLAITQVAERDINEIADFFIKSAKPGRRPVIPAGAINTLGEVPDSAWFTNRQVRKRLSPDELRRGPGDRNEPVPPFTVISGKTEGITPGFRMRDSAGRMYFVKVDPLTNPEMATAADVIVSKFLWAIGYNTPQNYIINPHKTDFHITEDATTTGINGSRRRMTWSDFEGIVDNIPHYKDGSFRLMASLAVEGKPIGPFRFERTRSDDPNDLVPHENRRDLRGLFVIAAWLNHTDAKSNNSLDVLVGEEGRRSIRHYLIDFGSSLGSDSDKAKDARYGHKFMLPSPSEAVGKILGLGLISPKWERAHYPHIDAVGHFESATFDPDRWKSDYPNPAFLSRLPDDEYWGAKQVMAFSDEEIRTIVDLGRFSDPRAAPYIAATLSARRDKIGRTFFSKVLPLDHFRVENGALHFDDLAVIYEFRAAQEYSWRWSRFDNQTSQHEVLTARTPQLPQEAAAAPAGAYFAVLIEPSTPSPQTVMVYLRKERDSFKVVGVDRTW